MSDLHQRIRASLGVPPRAINPADGNGYNAYRRNARGDRIRWWVARIEEDRNYARIILGLPLKEPINPGIREFRDAYDEMYR